MLGVCGGVVGVGRAVCSGMGGSSRGGGGGGVGKYCGH